jgi:hypothetical protein
MTTSHLRLEEGGPPLVAVVCSVPLVGEAVRSALEFAEVRTFTGQRDTIGLLEWLKPDVVVVDSDADARDASAYGLDHDVPVLHICVREDALRLFRHGDWEHVGNGEGATPEAVHNVVAGTLFARGGATA